MTVTPSTMVELGSALPTFRLPDAEGHTVGSDDYPDQPLLVIFMCNHCPFVKHLAGALADFTREYQARGLAVIGINSNDFQAHPDDRPEQMLEEARARGYTFPYLVDETQEVAHAFQAACTPDFFLFDRDHRLAYRGQFDDSRPGKETAVTGEDLRAAAEAVLADRAPPPDQKPSMGCNIKWK